MTHYYEGGYSLAAFSSGTGAAGLFGGLYYFIATSWFRISVRLTMIMSSFLPFLLYFTFITLLPKSYSVPPEYSTIDQSNAELLEQDNNSSVKAIHRIRNSITERLSYAKPLVIPYMIPLFLVYVGEYTINQGISPTLLFPISETPFREIRDMYPAYQSIYQVGVFISRSSSLIYRIPNVYLPSVLQILNVIICIGQSIFFFLPSIYLVMAIIFWEGLLGKFVIQM